MRVGVGLWLACLAGVASAQADDDCGRAVAPQRCQIHRQGLLSCQDLAEPRRRACLAYYTPPLSCQRQRDARRCEALLAAQASCEGMLGAARRQCLDERLPPVDCARAQAPCPADDAACDRPRRRAAGGCQWPLPLAE
ncbi:hypothetical protein [Chromobacterium sp. CV08]|uniref:hypothetical protein n=1 Tax=Chromobacterium sp. CV08 TaxID=3133274 RepID=UPI003DA8A57D